jgi:hypothetical protein
MFEENEERGTLLVIKRRKDKNSIDSKNKGRMDAGYRRLTI